MELINAFIRTWASSMYVLRTIAYLRGKGPFVRNDKFEAIILNNFLGKSYPYPHLPGTRFYGKLVKPLMEDGESRKVSLETLQLDVDIDFRREDGLAGIAQYQILYHVPHERKAIEKYGRQLGADPDRIIEPLKQAILEKMFMIKDETTLVDIAKDAQNSLTFDGQIYPIAEQNKEAFGIEVDGVSLEGIKYDHESQEIIRKKADALAEAQERQIMSEGLAKSLDNYFNSVKLMYEQRELKVDSDVIWNEAKRFYELDRLHSMTQNPGSTVIIGGGENYGSRFIPLRKKQEKENPSSEPGDEIDGEDFSSNE